MTECCSKDYYSLSGCEDCREIYLLLKKADPVCECGEFKSNEKYFCFTCFYENYELIG